ncbi:MAG: N-acetylneuraminate synthase [Flavobacteriaceae bacterium]|nr:N-acetylneuraminate synthase [Flavobacteriaceae bacterium]|tara:strand:- start:8821 stop:9825 length:1005 start_codon:yes stop_codon:yes gene_type:complete
MKKTIIIAEAGVNHNGDLKLAKKLVLAAKDAGADIVKFQSFTAENLATHYADKAKYQKSTTKKKESHFEMLKKLELTKENHFLLKRFCKNKKIEFLSSAFDTEGLDFLYKMRLKRFKIPSGEITNFPYLKKVAKFNKETILSTGMSSLEEIKESLGVLRKNGLSNNKITIMQCNTEYPTPLKDINLRAMSEMRTIFGTKIGYSDHSDSLIAPSFAVTLGAEIIEKHLTLDKKLSGPDHAASLVPNEFKEMVKNIRIAEIALGKKIKKPTMSEKKNIAIVRKSIVAKKDITKGDIFTEKNITTKRPAMGISPMKWDNIIGKKSKKNFKVDDLITN